MTRSFAPALVASLADALELSDAACAASRGQRALPDSTVEIADLMVATVDRHAQRYVAMMEYVGERFEEAGSFNRFYNEVLELIETRKQNRVASLRLKRRLSEERARERVERAELEREMRDFG